MDDNTRYILFGLAIPAAMGLLVGAMGAQGARVHPPGEAQPRSAQAAMSLIVAIVLAILAGALTLSTYGVHGGINLHVISSDDRLRFVPLQLFLVCLFCILVRVALGRRSGTPTHPLDRVIPVIAAFLAGGSAAGLALHSVTISAPKFLITIAFGAWACLACKFLIRFHDKERRIRAGVILIGLAAAVGAALLGTGSQFLGMYGFGVAAVAVGVTIGALALRGPTRPFTLAILTSFLATLLACGVYLSATPWWVVAVLACVVPLAYLIDTLASRRLGPRASATITVLVAATIALVAVAPGIKSLADFILADPSKDMESK